MMNKLHPPDDVCLINYVLLPLKSDISFCLLRIDVIARLLGFSLLPKNVGNIFSS